MTPVSGIRRLLFSAVGTALLAGPSERRVGFPSTPSKYVRTLPIGDWSLTLPVDYYTLLGGGGKQGCGDTAAGQLVT